MPDQVKQDEQVPPATLMTALLAAQAELPKLEKAAVNPHFKSKYISLDTIMAEVLPVLNKHGLVWVTLPGYRENETAVLGYRLIHAESGESLDGEMLLLAAKDDPQGQGAAITYARRYSMTALLGISADEDDDGNRAATSRRESQQRQREARQAPRALSPDELARMMEAIRERGLEPADVLRECEVVAPLEVTLAEAKRVKDFLAAVPAES